ncbi:MAG: alpha-2-macroglobulin, partial [Burkholderiales bacterium]
MKTTWSGILLLLAAGNVSAAHVEVFSPQGEVKGVRQVAVRFSEPMVAFGDPRLPEPFDIECPEPGTARWADQKNWVYDFGRDLPAGVRCGFRLKADLLSLAGDRLEGGQAFEFSTGGPAIVETLPYEGVPVDEEQILILGLDAAATDESIAANAYCDIKGITERVEVRVLAGDDRRVVLDARKDFVHRFVQSLMRGTRMDRMLKSGEAGGLPIAVVQCKRRLPNNAEIRLVWGKGIMSASGVATSQNQTIAYRVRDTFQARFSCDRVNKDAQCLPIMPMRLSFTAPVARSTAARITLKTAAGKAYPAELPDVRNAAEFVEEVSFTGPFPERAQFTLEMPLDVTDDAGRKLANQKRFPLQVRTDEYPPLAKFPARFGIIELKGDGMMPVTLRNLEALVETRMIKAGKQDDLAAEAADRADQAINQPKEKLDEPKHDEAGTVPGSYSHVADGDVMAMLEWMKRLGQMEHDRWGYDEKKQEQVLEYQVGQSSIFTERDRIRRMHVPKPQGARAFEVVGIL